MNIILLMKSEILINEMNLFKTGSDIRNKKNEKKQSSKII